jgi:hypothetical protein
MAVRRVPFILAAVFGARALSATEGSPPPRPLHGIGVEEALAGDPVLAPALDAARLPPGGLQPFVRLRVRPEEMAEDRLPALGARLDLYRAKGVPVILVFGGPLPRAEEAEAWGRSVQAVARRGRGAVRAYEVGDLGGASRPSAADFAFVLKVTAVQARAGDPDVLVILGGLQAGQAAWLEALYGEDAAAYLDAVAITVAEGMQEAALSSAAAALSPVVERADPTATLAATGVSLSPEPAQATRQLLDWQFRQLGSKVALSTYEGPPPALAGALAAAAGIEDVLGGEVVLLDDAAASLKLTLAGEDVTSTLPHRLLYNARTFSTYLVYWGLPGREGPLRVELVDAAGKAPVVRDAVSGRQARAREFSWDPETKLSRAQAPLAERPLLIDFNYGGGEAYVARTEVAESLLPTVGEVIARHQQAQAAQDARLRSYVALARMEQHFRPSATDPGFDVVTENRLFFDHEGTEWEELSFTLNGSKWGADRPPFPLLQPEKVLSLPLDLRLNKDYRYRLLGRETVAGRSAYAVRFEPLDDARSLYRGTVWIDSQTFVKLKVQAVQTRLGPPVISNEEVQHFAPVTVPDGEPLHLFSRLSSKQILLVAGRNLLVEREIHFRDFLVNAPDFAERRAASRGTEHVMYRDTDQGLRYFVKKDGQRVVQDRATTRARAAAFGVTIDPSYDFPLPIVGLNYLDFEFLGKDTQLALLFGGVLALVNVQHPQVFGDKVSASVDLFAIAVPVNDQVYDERGERRGERLRSIPFSTGLNVGYQLTDFQKVTGSYQLRFDAFFGEDRTAVGFRPPVDTFSHGAGLAYEYKRGGYSLGASGTHFRRAAWESWGFGDEFDPRHRSYQKYSVSLSKDFFKGLHKVHLNAAYFGGRRLDRFSMYQFGFFDENRIHGVPAAGVRFAELAMFRGSYSFNLFEQYRLDLFLDQALGRGASAPAGAPARPAFDRTWRNVTGLGLGLNLRGPFGTLLRTDFGKGFLPPAYAGSGSFVAQVMVLKPL